MTRAWLIALFVLAATPVVAQTPTHPPLARQYQAGQALAYRMTADNDGWHYTVEARAVVARDAGGTFHEDYAWSNLVSDGQAATLSPAMTAWRQSLSLDPDRMPAPPDLSQADPRLIGPITDLMTFYADLWLAAKFNRLNAPGDHFYFPNPMVPSWADGTRVLTGADAIDFDMTLKSLDATAGTAVLEVRHVPPPQPKLHLPAPWMSSVLAGPANNWVEVRKLDDGTFRAAVGVETFDVDITVSTRDGHMLRAEMTNPVKTVERICTDAALTQCGDAKPHDILRKVEIEQIP